MNIEGGGTKDQHTLSKAKLDELDDDFSNRLQEKINPFIKAGNDRIEELTERITGIEPEEDYEDIDPLELCEEGVFYKFIPIAFVLFFAIVLILVSCQLTDAKIKMYSEFLR